MEYIWETSGRKMDFQNWANGQPNNWGGSQQCAGIWFISSADFGTWDDGTCSYPGASPISQKFFP